MKRLSLQNDNKIKKGFFDLESGEEDIDAVNGTEANGVADNPEKKEKKSQKKFKAGAIFLIFAVCALLILAIALLCVDLSDGTLDGSFIKKDPTPTYYKIVDEPDWETDIYTLDEYLALNPDFLMYSSDGIATVGYNRSDVRAGTPLAFIQEYLDTIKQGDHQKLNSMFSDAYLAANGSFEAFPMQKLFSINIRRLNGYRDDRYEGKVYKYEYYEITYNIYRNDGYFCETADEDKAMVEGLMIIFDAKGNGKIEIRRDLRSFK